MLLCLVRSLTVALASLVWVIWGRPGWQRVRAITFALAARDLGQACSGYAVHMSDKKEIEITCDGDAVIIHM